MTSLDTTGRQSRDALPSINNFDFEKYRLDKTDNNRYSIPSMNTLAKNTMSSPPSTYFGPPPPYSSAAPSVSNPVQKMAGYMSPPESSSKRSVRDDKESPKGTLLPSISEALKSADVQPTTQSYTPISAPVSAVGQTFSDAPKGPGNPFSQPVLPVSAPRSSFSSVADNNTIQNVPPPPAPPDNIRPPPLISTIGSPRLSANHRASINSSSTTTQLDPLFRSSYPTDTSRPGYPFPDFHAPHTSTLPGTPSNFHFEQHNKLDESRNPFAKSESVPYNETVKRHLDVYDAELALNEIGEASAQTLEFSKVWSQRHHQGNRICQATDSLPSPAEIDDMMRYSQHVAENLSRLREAAIIQQNVLNEQRARAARGQTSEDDYHRMSEDYKLGGFAAGDAKKRRGKAAPPGRCHSCNRAETPEWRRGPDGARTLCNACGLHYAKLTRKMGANKAAVMTGSNLRPKSISDARQ